MSQLNFFMTKEEVKEKLDVLFALGQFQVFEGRFFDTETPTPISEKDQVMNNAEYTIWVKNDYCDAKCSVKAQGDYKGKFLFDSYKDPIIELSTCKFDDNLISPGRIYYKAGWVESPELRELHEKMCSKVVRLFKNTLHNLSSPFKISKEIEKLIAAGHEVELGRGGMRINKLNINGT